MKAWYSGVDPTSEMEEVFFGNGDTLPANFNVDSKDIKEGRKIGEGNWTVHEAEWLGRKVAVKKFVAESTFSNVSLTSREVNLMLDLRHPNVVKLLGFYLTPQKDSILECTMIMELMDCDLEGYIGKGPLSNDQVVYIIAEVARGMNHIHKRGCFHRDLKPENILLRKSFVTGFNVEVKIADFGSSELVGVGSINSKVGTIGYKAPEQFDFEPKLCPEKVDVFGFGALCFKILTGKKLYESPHNVREAIKKIDRALLSQQNLPENVVQMIWKCLDVKPTLRPNFEEISRILDGALLAIQERMPRPLAPSTSASLHLKESMWEGFQGHDHLESMLDNVGLSKKKHASLFIPFEELFVMRTIVSSVYEVEWKGNWYVLKIFPKDDTSSMGYSYMGRNYFPTFPKLSHKNIGTFWGYSITPDEEISIVMELMDMDLSRALHVESIRGSSKMKWTIVREIAEGMKYLHDQGVVHGDLKPANVVVSALNTEHMIVKLIDFASGEAFTTRYCAPERLRKHFLRSTEDVDMKKSDVYSFGILCQEVFVGVEPFHDMIYLREAILRGQRPPIPIEASPEMKHLIQRCWNDNPEERPNFFDICQILQKGPILHGKGQSNSWHLSRCCIL